MALQRGPKVFVDELAVNCQARYYIHKKLDAVECKHGI